MTTKKTKAKLGEWIGYGKTWGQFKDEDLNKSWTEIEIGQQGPMLIGHLNENGGLSDEHAPGNSEIVTRYRVHARPKD